MKQLAIRLTQNEIKLCSMVFPVDFDVRTLGENPAEDLTLLRGLPNLAKHGVKVNTFIRKAIQASTVVVVDPKEFVREGDGEANSVIKGTRKTIPLSDEEWEIIDAAQKKHFRYSTISITVVWMLYNYAAMLSKDPSLVVRRRTRQVAPLTAGTSSTVTLRLPNEIITFAAMQAQAECISVGRWIRECIIENWDLIKKGPTNLEEAPVSTDDFDYDLEDEL